MRYMHVGGGQAVWDYVSMFLHDRRHPCPFFSLLLVYGFFEVFIYGL